MTARPQVTTTTYSGWNFGGAGKYRVDRHRRAAAAGEAEAEVVRVGAQQPDGCVPARHHIKSVSLYLPQIT